MNLSNPATSDLIAQPLVLSHKTISSLPHESFSDPIQGTCVWQTIFSRPTTFTEALTVGIASCPPHTASREGCLALHRHKQAEFYHIISGCGIVKLNGVTYQVANGDAVFIPGNAEHGIWNVDEKNELRFLYVLAADGLGDVMYRFTGETN